MARDLMRELVDYLNDATKAYDEGKPYMSDQEWDDCYFRLLDMEHETGTAYPDSPTQNINYSVVNELTKVNHNHKMLSLQKTKDYNELVSFFSANNILAMVKMDGLTCSLTYENGKLVRAETRGNGLVGEDIFHNAMVIPSIPKRISRKEKIVIDGEIICTKKDFEDFQNDYKNPRNFAAGSIRLLDAKECAARKLTFVAWEVIEGLEEYENLSEAITYLKNWHFITVPYVILTKKVLEHSAQDIVEMVWEFGVSEGYPADGVVFKYNNRTYGRTLGATSHHLKNAIAFKLYDETYTTHLIDIEWTMGRTGVLTPVAIFEPIDIDGSTVERASLHNMSVLKDTLHGRGWVGQEVQVFKSNMIIPQIATAEQPDDRTAYYFMPPAFCPICKEVLHTKKDNNSEFLVCTNDACEGKLINKLDHFCSKKGLDIKGLSKATLEKLVDWGWLDSFVDIFELKNRYANEWVKKPGFGVKSVQNILNAIDASRDCELPQFIAALGIPLVGTSVSKDLAKQFGSWKNFVEAAKSNYKFYMLNGFGTEMHEAIVNYNYDTAIYLTNCYINVKDYQASETANTLDGVNVVITGKLTHFKNRAELQEAIEAAGGKVVGSVSKNTHYLINNDVNSTSSKNVSAKKLGISILTEQEFLEKFLTF